MTKILKFDELDIKLKKLKIDKKNCISSWGI